MNRENEIVKALICALFVVFSIISIHYNEKGVELLSFFYLLASIVNLFIWYEIYFRNNLKKDLVLQINFVILTGMVVIEIIHIT